MKSGAEYPKPQTHSGSSGKRPIYQLLTIGKLRLRRSEMLMISSVSGMVFPRRFKLLSLRVLHGWPVKRLKRKNQIRARES